MCETVALPKYQSALTLSVSAGSVAQRVYAARAGEKIVIATNMAFSLFFYRNPSTSGQGTASNPAVCAFVGRETGAGIALVLPDDVGSLSLEHAALAGSYAGAAIIWRAEAVPNLSDLKQGNIRAF